MAYTVYDSTSSKFLELSLISWDQYQPTINISIRPKGSGINKADASILMQISKAYELLMNLSDPMNTSIVQGSMGNVNYSVGRLNNEFIITNGNGSAKVSLNERQWLETYNYLNLMYTNASLVKEIITGVRMTVINLFRQLGIDKPTTNNGRTTWTTTSWWDREVDKKISNNNMQTSSSIESQNYNNHNNMPMPNNMPPKPMGPIPTGVNNEIPSISMPNMGASMPPMPSPGSLAGGIQDMLNSAFQS